MKDENILALALLIFIAAIGAMVGCSRADVTRGEMEAALALRDRAIVLLIQDIRALKAKDESK